MIIAILAILKLGTAYVPLSPENPIDRNSFIIDEVEARMILAEKPIDQLLSHHRVDIINLDEVDLSAYPSSVIEASISDVAIAYVIYTSGSTGQPKGVLIPHSAAAAAVESMIQMKGRREGEWRSLQFSNIIFDASVLDIFNTLNSGGTLCLAPTDRLLSELTEVINEMGVTHSFFTPTVIRLVSPSAVPSLRTLTIGREQGCR